VNARLERQERQHMEEELKPAETWKLDPCEIKIAIARSSLILY
jgi:hypothetical protein